MNTWNGERFAGSSNSIIQQKTSSVPRTAEKVAKRIF